MFWICAACSVAWFSAVVKGSAAATMPASTAGLVTLSQLFSMAWRQELPAIVVGQRDLLGCGIAIAWIAEQRDGGE